MERINYYRARLAWATAATQRQQCFAGQSNSLYNDLKNGYLPNRESGSVISLMVRPQPEGTLVTADLNASMEDSLDFINQVTVKFFVSDVELFRAPVWACGHPPAWLVNHNETTADTSIAMLQNGGYPLPFVPIPVGESEGISVVLEGTMANAPHAAFNVDVVVGVRSIKVI